MKEQPRQWVTGEVLPRGFTARLNILERVAFYARVSVEAGYDVTAELEDALRELAAWDNRSEPGE